MDRITTLKWALAKIIKEARETKGLTQGQLAGFAGLSEIYLSRLECGDKGASLDALMQIAGALGIRPSELMRRIEEAIEKGASAPSRKQGRPSKGRPPNTTCL